MTTYLRNATHRRNRPTAGLLFNASGAIQAAGRVEGDLMRVDLAEALPGAWSGLRGLRGEQGVLALSFDSTSLANNWVGTIHVAP